MSLVYLLHYLMLNMFRMLIHPSSGACDLFVELFHVMYCAGSAGCGWSNKSQAPEDGCINIRNMLSINL